MGRIERLSSALTHALRVVTGEADIAATAMRAAYEDNFDGLIVLAEDYRVLAASRVAARMLLGTADGSLVGRTTADLLPESMLRLVQRAFAEGRVGEASPMSRAEIGDPDAGGYFVQYVATLSELRHGPSALPRRFVNLTFWDETDRRRREEEINFLGTHDALTGALTRAELVRAMAAALHSDGLRQDRLHVLKLELSRLRAVNDLLGHANGDLLLKQLVTRIKASGFEAVARLGGDTFAMIHVGRASGKRMTKLCETLLARVTQPYILMGKRAVVGASLGFAGTEVSGTDPETLLNHADIALWAAKSRPGNVAVPFDEEMALLQHERRQVDVALRSARANSQLQLLYQPQVRLANGDLDAVEALVRWHHPERGLMMPEQFLPIAEANGEIVEIGRWALRTACNAASGWPFETRIAVNVSAAQFALSDVVAEVQEALSESGLPPDRLELEIGEEALLADPEGVTAALERLRRLGVRVAIDDFGKSYSALGHLSRLPFDKVKIDAGFVAGLPTDTHGGAIIRAVVMLAETLNKSVVAQGVETPDQAWMLRLTGCELGQGFELGRPLTAPEMARWFDKGGPRTRLAAH